MLSNTLSNLKHKNQDKGKCVMDIEFDDFLKFLLLCKIRLGPGKLLQKDRFHHYIYQPATQFPQNSLIRDTIDYFKRVRGKIKDRRVGVLLYSVDKHLFCCILNLIEPNTVLAQTLKSRISSDANTDTILKDGGLVQSLRKLYKKCECVIVGINPQTDKPIVQQVGQLIANAYAIEAMPLHWVPAPPRQSMAAFFYNVLAVFKHGLFTPEGLKRVQHMPLPLPHEDKLAIDTLLKEKLDGIRVQSTNEHEQVLAALKNFSGYLAVIKWCFRQGDRTVDMRDYKKVVDDSHKAVDAEALVTDLSYDLQLPLIIKPLGQLLPLLNTMHQQVLFDIKRWETAHFGPDVRVENAIKVRQSPSAADGAGTAKANSLEASLLLVKNISIYNAIWLLSIVINMAELIVFQQFRQLLVFICTIVSGLASVGLVDDKQQPMTEERRVKGLLALLGGQLVGRVVALSAIFLYTASQVRSAHRNIFMEELRGRGEANQIYHVDVYYPYWLLSVWNLMIGSDPVQLSLVLESGVFYSGTCDIANMTNIVCDPPLYFDQDDTVVPGFLPLT